MKNIATAAKMLGVLLLGLLLFSCPPQDATVVVPDNFGELTAKYSVLSRIPFSLVAISSYKSVIDRKSLPKLDAVECPPFSEAPKGSVFVDRQMLVPVVPLHSLVGNLSLEDARAYFAEGRPLPDGIIILPLSKLELPLKAIPVDGKYVSDSDYPLVSRLYLSVELMPAEPETEQEGANLTEKLAGGIEALKIREHEIGRASCRERV